MATHATSEVRALALEWWRDKTDRPSLSVLAARAAGLFTDEKDGRYWAVTLTIELVKKDLSIVLRADRSDGTKITRIWVPDEEEQKVKQRGLFDVYVPSLGCTYREYVDAQASDLYVFDPNKKDEK